MFQRGRGSTKTANGSIGCAYFDVAVAEKLAHLEHEEWARNRKQPTNELAARALSLLGRAGNKEVAPSDILPKGYRSKRR
jgi:hypothetical protein